MTETSPAPSTPPSPVVALHEAAVAAGQATDSHDYLQQATEQLSRLLDADHCSLLVLRGGRLYHGGSVGLTSSYLDAIDGTEVGPDEGACGAAVVHGETVITRDIREDPRWKDFVELTEAAGLRSCWSVPLLVRDGNVLGTFATYGEEPGEPTPEQVEMISAHASLVALGLERLRHDEELRGSYEAVVLALSSALDVRDEYTGTHSTETALLAVQVGLRLGLADAELRQLEQAAVLHDIGKLGIPAEILRAPRPLTDEEIEIVHQHPVLGEQILKGVPFLERVARAVRHEHERWDGGGYPDGLSGSTIPRASRIVFASDAWHAMTSDRPYRPALERSAALEELRRGGGSQFDPDVVDALLGVLREEAPPEAAAVQPPIEGEDPRARELSDLAHSVGAEDLFVFRKVSPDRFSHFGGTGRGEGWAGNIELGSDGEEAFGRALRSGAPVCVEFDERGRVMGPYYARTAVVVPLRPDLVVVLGSSSDALSGGCGQDSSAVAERAAAVVGEVSPAKQLADELEVLDASRSITAITGDSLEDALSQIADAGARALSCEYGAVLVFGEEAEPRLGFSERGWSPGEPGAVAGLLVPFLTDQADLPLLVQDVCAGGPVPETFADLGATSIHALPIGSPQLGVLLLVHADPTPRGFTTLCRRVARTVAEAAEIVIRRSLAHERLTTENELLSRRVRTDALTGVASRTAWEDALRREESHRGRSGATTSIAVFDLNGLKHINDRHGHAVGDELLRAGAAVLADCARATDLVARIGGDEFGVLLRYTDPEGADRWRERVCSAVEGRPELAPGLRLSMAAGTGSAPPAGTLAEAFDSADKVMYASKVGTRALAVQPDGQ